ncbi:ATP synthase F0, A subunit [Hydrogenobacter thermophilus TK-6]|uniref:ATP synthase subunit a n=1 Tax=Hydrogenobacter thermophilus (strain DSM 6534 / IAM 12695 / TK-6) TaxID=608538 RepID=D3DJ22_HYDTT|nr:F0F1 ATP synthase subunit A [Hydrogenobacter thermophilus]ADO45749.1 ATP synthase F0, A subunit [Hydrogenobacter thermophilus TK-6]BAI69824.1 ATP synthase A chain [Hydrogenobacter thermophilus TK-6]
MEKVSLEHVYLGVLAMAISLALILLAGRPSIRPTRFQALWEGYLRFVRSMLLENAGKEGIRYTPIIASIGLFVFFSNLFGMVPGLEAPTANVNTNLALALSVFILYNLEGFRIHGFGYLKHFMGPNVYLAPFFFLIEVISHLARPITLTLRLFANMKGGALLLLVLVSLVIKNPFTMAVSPVILLFIIAIKFLAIFIQSYIFMILSVVYLSGAISHEEH